MGIFSWLFRSRDKPQNSYHFSGWPFVFGKSAAGHAKIDKVREGFALHRHLVDVRLLILSVRIGVEENIVAHFHDFSGADFLIEINARQLIDLRFLIAKFERHRRSCRHRRAGGFRRSLRLRRVALRRAAAVASAASATTD